MPSSVIFLTVLISVIIASTNGFKIETAQPINNHASGYYVSSSSKINTQSGFSFLNQPIAGYPKVPPANAYESGGVDDDLLPPFEEKTRSQSFRRSLNVDPKTGYPLTAEPSWKDAGGNEESLELPLEDDANPQEAVDPKTGYPLVAQPGWEHAGGDGDIIQLPLEDPLVDPKTGYPLIAQPSWKDAGGNEETLQLPLEDPEESPKVDPKTVYPLVAQPSWQDAGGNGEILDLPEEEPKDQNQVAVDPKTGYPLVAEPSWKHAGGDGEILDLPLEDGSDPQEKVDPKTGYPLVAQPTWQFAGGDEQILELPLEDNTVQGRSGDLFDETRLTELRPPDVQSVYSTDFGDVSSNTFARRSFQEPLNVFQRRNTGSSEGNIQQSRAIESTYTYTGPENVVVSVTRYLSTNNPNPPTFQNNFATSPRSQSSFTRRQIPTPYQRN